MNKENIFFASDYHSYHKNVIRFDKRPFKDVDEMNQALIDNWNAKVGKNGVVYYLGDLSFTGFQKTKEFVDQLNGTIHFIMGNHDDYKMLSKLNRFETIDRGYREIWVDDEQAQDKHGTRQQICMTHYPMIVWNRHHHGAWHLHGHCHQSLWGSEIERFLYTRKVLDVGCNGHNYEPVSYLEVKEIFKDRVVLKLDHHE